MEGSLGLRGFKGCSQRGHHGEPQGGYQPAVGAGAMPCRGFFFYRKGTTKQPPINKGFFKEYETYIKDVFGKSIEINGPPLASKDPREDFANCLEKTVRNKIKKMTYLHIYFKVI